MLTAPDPVCGSERFGSNILPPCLSIPRRQLSRFFDLVTYSCPILETFHKISFNITSWWFQPPLKNMNVQNGDFLKWLYPQITHFNMVFHYKSSILGYHHLRKHPNGFIFPKLWGENIKKMGNSNPGTIITSEDHIGRGSGFLTSTTMEGKNSNLMLPQLPPPQKWMVYMGKPY